MSKQNGFTALEVLIGAAVIILLLAVLSVRANVSEEIVSGVVYNNKNNAFISGNTTFSIRASENTVVTEENKSSYCLPSNSPYMKLVNDAAKDKSIKVVVTTKKYITLVPTPWTCVDNVSVNRQ